MDTRLADHIAELNRVIRDAPTKLTNVQARLAAGAQGPGVLRLMCRQHYPTIAVWAHMKDRPDDTLTAVHEAWLQETIDLRERLVQEYANQAVDQSHI